MVDLSIEMAELWNALGASEGRRARVIQFTAALGGQGVSTVAREFAFHAATRMGRRVWLVDLDLMGGDQLDALGGDAARYGALGPPAVASPDGSAFFTVQPPLRRPDGRVWPASRYLAAHSVGGETLWATRFRREALRAQQEARIVAAPDYWNALRRHADLVVVDAPAADRSDAAAIVARSMDDTVLIVAADEPNVAASGRARDALTIAGARCAGVFLNRAMVAAPRFMRGAR